MRKIPRGWIPAMVHSLALICIAYLFFGPESLVLDPAYRASFEEWPQLWVFTPTVALVINLFMICYDFSAMGLFTTAACGLWLKYAYDTLPQIFALLGG